MKTQKKLEIDYLEYERSALSLSDKELVYEAIEAAKNAYAPYSKFYVGAAVQLRDGSVLKAGNQENAAYPSGLCAERVAVFFANANHHDNPIDTLVVVVINDKHQLIESNISPCGACRQVIAESEVRYKTPIRILLVSNTTVLEFKSVKDLLPFSFNQGDLNRG